MGTYTQRKQFDHPDLAAEQALEFQNPAWSVPGIEVSTQIVEGGDGIWLYLTQQGELIGNDRLVLPGWELVG